MPKIELAVKTIYRCEPCYRYNGTKKGRTDGRMDRGRQQVDHIHGHNPHFKKNTDLDHATGITDLKSDRQ